MAQNDDAMNALEVLEEEEDEGEEEGNVPKPTSGGATNSSRNPNASPRRKSRRGFAAMDPAKQRAIASQGGKHQGKENNPGNFANNPARAREAGRKGGQS